MKKDDRYKKALCQVIRVSYYRNDLQTLRLIYETLVMRGIINEFSFNLELWNRTKKIGKPNFMYYQEEALNFDLDFGELVMLMKEYPYFMGILEEPNKQADEQDDSMSDKHTWEDTKL